jgi:hypothetical protein
MAHSPQATQAGLLLAAAGVLVFAGLARAASNSEVRDFTTFIDGKQAGDYQMTITTQDDDSVTMTGRASIDIRVLVVGRYRYTYNGTETWKDGRLARFESSGNDNGKQFQVTAAPDADGLHVKANGREHIARGEAWLTTYWRLPDRKLRDQPLSLLEADTGRDLAGNLEYVGLEEVSVAGQTVRCAHYRLTGGVHQDLWYDGTERLVRQEWVEDGKKVLLQLSSLRR